MSSRATSRFTQAELSRAIRAAKATGTFLRVLRDGSLEFVDRQPEGADVTPERPLASRREFSL